MHALIFKICPNAEWKAAEAAGIHRGSDKDREDGFLHFSTAEQLMGTLARHYADANDLVLVAVDATALGSALKYEPSRDGQMFPHLYGDLPPAAVRWVRPIARGRQGSFVLPARLTA
ncbi:MAG TPA: DUF952 domain-containing protein [Rhizomicrobium sp.]|jgi:uncharacterized protein (DUF952 family)|nr:DUF952 domain-containing protein [Rhizomicrobium sp.]